MSATVKHMIVVGAGVIGASIAYHLARHGIKVTVIEQDHPASGATGSAFGWLHTTVCDDAPDALLRHASVDDWHRLEKEIPELKVRWTGALSYGANAPEIQQGGQMLARSEISQLEPAMNAPPPRAHYANRDGAVEPADATRALLDKACSLGALLKTQTPVTGFIKEGARIVGITTPQGALGADCIVLACGTGIPPLLSTLGVSLPIEASPAILLRYRVAAPVVNTLISGDDLEVRHDRCENLLAAEDYPVSGDIGALASETLAAIKSRLRGTASASLLSQSVAQRPVPQDGRPVMGFIDDMPGIYVAAMHPGVTCAATIGRMASEELAAGNNPDIPESYRPARFNPLRR
ncbi:Monomeric sarcosine oxidase [Serratia entomophila]|uniref:NAD(P)/FAD-dependent oxidoreductase n=1 Tax=Serratia entomophila TaxID=42906 RepID=UPI00217ABA40|nr:FAD-binding oxidoreductase [Serratia entomophila]CAI0901190.1 Monomeric sarcosine oxidase [Serratia entomophila]CAI0936908.1 Monomeric sarcosine oxidase [Serratia entomophila]CAI2090915.1 Monomeric sarcosine oxidase [Serratia entomophila]